MPLNEDQKNIVYYLQCKTAGTAAEGLKELPKPEKDFEKFCEALLNSWKLENYTYPIENYLKHGKCIQTNRWAKFVQLGGDDEQ